MTDKLELELVPEETEPEKVYPFLADDDQQLRCCIFEKVASADIDGAIQIQFMESAFQWIKNGLAQPEQHKRSPVRKVSDNG